MTQFLPDESLNVQELFVNLITDVRKVSWSIWALIYLCLLLPTGRTLRRSANVVAQKYSEYQVNTKVQQLFRRQKSEGTTEGTIEGTIEGTRIRFDLRSDPDTEDSNDISISGKEEK